MAQTKDVATVPKVPEAGLEFHVAHLRDVAELQLGIKPPEGVKYQWTVTVMDGKREVGLEAAGLTLPLANTAALKIKRARSHSEYRFTLSKTTAGKEEVYPTLIVNFERDGAAALVSTVIPTAPVEPAPTAIETSPRAPSAADPFAPPPPPPPAPRGEDPSGALPAAGADPITPPAPAAAPRRGTDIAAPGAGAEALLRTPGVSGDAASEALAAGSVVEDRFGKEAMARARAEATEYVAKNIPTTPLVLTSPTYFLDKYKKEYSTTRGKLTLLSKQPFMAPNEVARAMLEVASVVGTPEALLEAWIRKEEELFKKLREPDAFEQSILTADETEVWRQFLQEWREDVRKADPQRFRDALTQAAYEIRKAAIGTFTNAVTLAKTGAGASANDTSIDGAADGGLRSSGSPFHERRMNHIYRHHSRRMYRADLIRARR